MTIYSRITESVSLFAHHPMVPIDCERLIVKIQNRLCILDTSSELNKDRDRKSSFIR